MYQYENNMYQYVSQYVINLHNLRIKQYVPICTNMYHHMYPIYIT